MRLLIVLINKNEWNIHNRLPDTDCCYYVIIMVMKTKLQRLKEECVKIASDLNLKKNPYCVFCGKQATVSHHFIRQSRSNYLRCDERNLISICQQDHLRLHSGYESVMTLQLQKKFGKEWRDGLIRDSNKTIKDGIKYWTELKIKLQKYE